MPDTNFKQHALAFGDTNATVTVTLDGAVIYQGEVNTLNTPAPSLPNLDYTIDNNAWTWTLADPPHGTRSYQIAVAGATLILADTLIQDTNGDWSSPYAGPAGNTLTDPLFDATIDGVAVSAGERAQLSGQWWWKIPAGSTFAANLRVGLGT